MVHKPPPSLTLSLIHSFSPLLFSLISLAVQSEVHEPAQHFPVAAQRCHHIGTGRRSGQHSAAGHGTTAETHIIATVTFSCSAAVITKVSAL